MESRNLNRRAHKRFNLTEEIFIMCHDRAGRIVNISEGGMSIKITDSIESFPDTPQTPFQSVTPASDINGLTLKIVRKDDLELPRFGGFSTQTVGVKFDNPTHSQLKKIRNHISAIS